MRVPILLYEDMVLDGRNRQDACEEAGVEPRYQQFEGTYEDARAEVISLNIARRDLTPSKRALAAARFLDESDAGKVGRPRKAGKSSGISRVSIAKQFKVSAGYVAYAVALLERAPDLVEAVEAGAMTLEPAHDELKKRDAARKEEQRQLALTKAGDFPGSEYRVILADPPWEYADERTGTVQAGADSLPLPRMFQVIPWGIKPAALGRLHPPFCPRE